MNVPVTALPMSTSAPSTFHGRLVDAEPARLLDNLGNAGVYLYYRQEMDDRSLLQGHAQATAALVGSDLVTPLEIFHRASV